VGLLPSSLSVLHIVKTVTKLENDCNYTKTMTVALSQKHSSKYYAAIIFLTSIYKDKLYSMK
jgi:hypothetical protein